MPTTTRQSFPSSFVDSFLTTSNSIEKEDLQRAEVLEKYTAFEEARAQSITKAASTTTFDPSSITFAMPLPKVGMSLDEVLVFGKALITGEEGEVVVGAKAKGRKSATKGKGKARASTVAVDDLEASLAAVRLQVCPLASFLAPELIRSGSVADGEFPTTHASNYGIRLAVLDVHRKSTSRITRASHASRRRRIEHYSRFRII